MDRCPICRATLNGATTTCRRCRADLGEVQKVADLASDLTGAAMLCLAQGHTGEARRLLARARLLHATPGTVKLLAFGQGSWQAEGDAGTEFKPPQQPR